MGESPIHSWYIQERIVRRTSGNSRLDEVTMKLDSVAMVTLTRTMGLTESWYVSESPFLAASWSNAVRSDDSNEASPAPCAAVLGYS